MTTAFRLRQARTIALLELRRVFLSKRSFWVYFLALFPSVIFIGHGLEVKVRQNRWGGRVTNSEILETIQRGDTVNSVIDRAGVAIVDEEWRWRDGSREVQQRRLVYYDGKRRFNLIFREGILENKGTHTLVDASEDRKVFAGVFQYFYLRLAIFFGCLGIFMNLFRGEMLDKTLHFWLLVPARRETLLVGKYLAGLTAAVVIFTAGAMLCFGAMMWPQDPVEAQTYWQSAGASHLFWYAAAAALACVGYGSVFLAAGMLLRNPIIPAAVLLLWESINGFLPTMLQKLSVLYYVQAICPVPAPIESDAPALLRLLLSPAEPPPVAMAVLGLFGVTVLVLWAAARAVRRLEINYGTE